MTKFVESLLTLILAYGKDYVEKKFWKEVEKWTNLKEERVEPETGYNRYGIHYTVEIIVGKSQDKVITTLESRVVICRTCVCDTSQINDVLKRVTFYCHTRLKVTKSIFNPSRNEK